MNNIKNNDLLNKEELLEIEGEAYKAFKEIKENIELSNDRLTKFEEKLNNAEKKWVDAEKKQLSSFITIFGMFASIITFIVSGIITAVVNKNISISSEIIMFSCSSISFVLCLILFYSFNFDKFNKLIKYGMPVFMLGFFLVQIIIIFLVGYHIIH